jgi:hypothetical protein
MSVYVDLDLDSRTERLCSIVTKQPTNVSRKYQDIISAFLDLTRRVSASRCHHQGVVVPSEATLAVCIVDVYGLWLVQCTVGSVPERTVHT